MMAKEINSWGRIVNLPMNGASRYWLRDQQDGGRFSTAEALVFLLKELGLRQAAEDLRLQLELHVYANLRARGKKDAAALFLTESTLNHAFPELLVQLNTRRPR